jgi:hypothetical protein
MIDAQPRFEAVRAEWLAINRLPPLDEERFAAVKREASALVDAGHWTSGPQDMLRVIGRHRDELIHSRLIAWLLVPTNRHALGRAFAIGFADHHWPGESLLSSGPVVVETEVPGAGLDESGQMRAARADIVVRGDSVTVVIENKVGASEQPAQCERLYWAWAGEPGDTRWVFLTPSGRPPSTAVSDAAKGAWRTMSYSELRAIFGAAVNAAAPNATSGRATAIQYLVTLMGRA